MYRILTFALLIGSVFLTVPAHAAEPSQVAAIGDSITMGVGDTAGSGYAGRADVEHAGFGGRCLAVSCAGQTPLRDDFASIVRAFPVKPRILVLEIGVNDLNHLGDYALKAAYRDVVAQGAAMGVHVVLSTIVPLTAAWPWAGIDEQRRRINAWMRTRPEVVDYAAALERRNGWGYPRFSADGLHPNVAGHRIMAHVLRQWIAGVA